MSYNTLKLNIFFLFFDHQRYFAEPRFNVKKMAKIRNGVVFFKSTVDPNLFTMSSDLDYPHQRGRDIGLALSTVHPSVRPSFRPQPYLGNK